MWKVSSDKVVIFFGDSIVSPETISIISAVVAVFSAMFAGWTIKEAKKVMI